MSTLIKLDSQTLGGTPMLFATGGGSALANGATRYGTIGGGTLLIAGSEAGAQTALPAGDIEKVKFIVGSNTANGAIIIRIRVNGASAGPTITIPAATTGTFSDSTVTTIADGDLVNFQIDATASSSGSCNVQNVVTQFRVA